MEVINVQRAKTHLSKYLEDVADGQELILGKSGKPIAKLIPYKAETPKRTFGGMDIWIAPTVNKEKALETDYESEYLIYNSPLFPEEGDEERMNAEAKIYANILKEKSKSKTLTEADFKIAEEQAKKSASLS